MESGSDPLRYEALILSYHYLFWSWYGNVFGLDNVTLLTSLLNNVGESFQHLVTSSTGVSIHMDSQLAPYRKWKGRKPELCFQLTLYTVPRLRPKWRSSSRNWTTAGVRTWFCLKLHGLKDWKDSIFEGTQCNCKRYMMNGKLPSNCHDPSSCKTSLGTR